MRRSALPSNRGVLLRQPESSLRSTLPSNKGVLIRKLEPCEYESEPSHTQSDDREHLISKSTPVRNTMPLKASSGTHDKDYTGIVRAMKKFGKGISSNIGAACDNVPYRKIDSDSRRVKGSDNIPSKQTDKWIISMKDSPAKNREKCGSQAIRTCMTTGDNSKTPATSMITDGSRETSMKTDGRSKTLPISSKKTASGAEMGKKTLPSNRGVLLKKSGDPLPSNKGVLLRKPEDPLPSNKGVLLRKPEDNHEPDYTTESNFAKTKSKKAFLLVTDIRGLSDGTNKHINAQPAYKSDNYKAQPRIRSMPCKGGMKC